MTDIAGALRKASQDRDTDTIILLTDGKPTAGITDTEQLLKDVRSWNKFKKIKINTVGMAGCDPNFLQKLAQQNGGSYSNAP
jgi:Mg-chelatase subunit ChlD